MSIFIWKLVGLQKLTISHRVGDTRKKHLCKFCRIEYSDLNESIQHTNHWHRTPDCWFCPSLANAITPGIFFDTAEETISDDISVENPDEKHDGTYDFCLCCGEVFHDSPPDWTKRKQHWKDKHNFDENTSSENFFREEQFLLHLANSHNIRLEYLADLMEYCRKKDRAPVLVVGPTD
jgi:hypothetical protein